MLFLHALALAASLSSSEWSHANQPSGSILSEATILSDGRWIATDTAGVSWSSSDRGASWSHFLTPDGTADAQILGNGVVLDQSFSGDSWCRRYDAASSSWAAMKFDRKVYTTDSTASLSYMWMEDSIGAFNLELKWDDSILAFHSTDSARSWSFFASAPTSIAPGNEAEHSIFAGGRVWFDDTVANVLRGTDGSHWLELPMPSGFSKTWIIGALPGGTLIAMAQDAEGKISGVSTTDSGKTWQAYDLSKPGLIPDMSAALSEGWSLTSALVSNAECYFIRNGSGAWHQVPTIEEDEWNDYFVDNGRLYATDSTGLVSLDLASLLQADAIQRNTNRLVAPTWHLDGKNVIVSGAESVSAWRICDPSGKMLAHGRASGAFDLPIPLGSLHGMLLLQLAGTSAQALPIFVP
jgi:hypothetical protein